MRNILGVLYLLCVLSCIDEIKIDLPEALIQHKVIEGYVERDRNNYLIWGQVSLTEDVTGIFSPEPVPASIRIRYNGTQEFSIPPGLITRYPINLFHDTYGGSPETARFQLVAEVEGQRYISTEQMIVSVPRPDSLSVQVEERSEVNAAGNVVLNEYAILRVHTPLINDQNELVSLNWVVNSVYQFVEGTRSDPDYMPKTCYAGYNIFQNDINIAGFQDYPGSTVISNEIARTPVDFRFGLSLYFTVVQKSMTQDAIDYWKEVKASNERSGNIYDVFPGRIRTNVTSEETDEIVHGFFQVSEVDTIRLKVKPEMVDYPYQSCFFWQEPMFILPDDPDPCLDCLKLVGSTLTPPHYWR